ncbi:MAG: exopolysaccharide biosynthesis polyprenyl glycosylphosphotransferase, partial [Thermoanaerobaculia bacterium]
KSTAPVGQKAARMAEPQKAQAPTATEHADMSPTTEVGARLERLGQTRTWARGARIALLVVTDTLAVLTGAVAGYFAWAGLVLRQPPGVYIEVWPLIFLFPLAYAKWGLYPGFGLGAVETVRRLSLASSFIFLSLAAINYALKIPHQYSRISFVLSLAFTLVLAPLFRFVVLSLAQRWSWWGERCVILGSGPVAAQTVRSLRRAVSLGLRPVAAVSRREIPERTEIEGIPLIGGSGTIPLVAAAGVRVALIADEKGLDGGAMVDQLQQHFRQVILLRGQLDIPVEGVEVRNLGGVFGLEFVNQLLRRRNRLVKRSMDIGLGSVLLVISLPLVGVSALLVKLFSRGPAFYEQQREGLGGRPISVRKLRTMYIDADKRLEAHLEADPSARAEWQNQFKLKEDPRIIPGIGFFLRRFSIDELPQLWSVVTGDMSLVGPRPFPAYHLTEFRPEFRVLRRRVRPGLTGLWQVMIRGEGSIQEQETHDTYYIRNWSLWMDCYLLTRTLATVIRGRGAY